MAGVTIGCMNNGVYCASKAYVRFFTEALAVEVKEWIDVELLHPSFVHTNMV
jgi:short-subunit dehydrogenase